MTFKFVACTIAAATLAMSPVSQASAHPWHHHGGLIFGLGAAVVGTAVAVATVPFRVLAPPPAYPAPGYYPAPAYAPPPAYYAPPPAYYAPPPAYYAPPAYYYGR